MFKEALATIYSIFVNEGGRRSKWMEIYTDYNLDLRVSSDNIWNESAMYEFLFTGDNRRSVEILYFRLAEELLNRSYEECEDIFDAIAYLQNVVATALWKYGHNVGPMLEEFARDFDRLDVGDERRRLYEFVQNLPMREH